jgi:hypothetical protein
MWHNVDINQIHYRCVNLFPARNSDMTETSKFILTITRSFHNAV